MTKAQKFGKVAVIYGGNSAEREISLLSGEAVLTGLLAQNIDAQGLDTNHDLLLQLQKNQFDRAFIVLHGRGGEDGTLQGALELLNCPYTGSGVAGSALAMDKYRTKLVWQSLNLATPPFVICRHPHDLENADKLGYPLIIKPIHEGSSIGMTKVNQKSELLPAWQAAKEFDDLIMIEKWVTGQEFTVAILDGNALPAIRLEVANQFDFYDYQAKYESNETQYHCPCGLTCEKEQQMQQIALEAFHALGLKGWGRMDFMQDGSGQFWLLEANTVPGMTSHSLVPMAAKAANIDFNALLLLILETSMEPIFG